VRFEQCNRGKGGAGPSASLAFYLRHDVTQGHFAPDRQCIGLLWLWDVDPIEDTSPLFGRKLYLIKDMFIGSGTAAKKKNHTNQKVPHQDFSLP